MFKLETTQNAILATQGCPLAFVAELERTTRVLFDVFSFISFVFLQSGLKLILKEQSEIHASAFLRDTFLISVLWQQKKFFKKGG